MDEWEMDETNVYNRYTEVASLGKGRGVWLVFDRETQKVFVKKCREYFNESVYRCMMQIRDSHIPRIVSYEEKGGVLNIIEEYIAGETLLEKMERGVTFSEEEIKDIITQLCDGVERLHEQPVPIIHRDIKPSNIMISSDGVVKLIDYNAARHYNTAGVSSDTRYMGTPGYAAPEQYGFSQSDERTDIYAIGVVLNYLLTGRHISERVAEGKLGKVVEKCIQLDPQKRYQSVHQIQVVLRRHGPQRPNMQQGIWPIPGFRSGQIWKMCIAVMGYSCICLLALDTSSPSSRIPILWAAEGLSKIISFLFIVAMVTDYKEIQRNLPLVDTDILILRWFGYGVWGMAVTSAAIGVYMVLEQIVFLFV